LINQGSHTDYGRLPFLNLGLQICEQNNVKKNDFAIDF